MNNVVKRHLNKVTAIALGLPFTHDSFTNEAREAAFPVNPAVRLTNGEDWDAVGNNKQAIQVAKELDIRFEELWCEGDKTSNDGSVKGCYCIFLGVGKDLPIYIDLAEFESIPSAIRYGVCSLAYEYATGHSFDEGIEALQNNEEW